MEAVCFAGLAPGWGDLIEDSVPWRPPLVPTLVVVPHPDDESLATGGAITHLRRHDVPVAVMAVTDGEAAYPEQVAPDALAQVRRNEQRRALQQLDVPLNDVWRLGLADGGVGRKERLLRDQIRRLAERLHVEHIVAPWVHDHHPDHEACGRAAVAAAEIIRVPVTSSLFWSFHRTRAPSPSTHRLRRLALSDDERRSKQAAVGCHVTQSSTAVAPSPILDDATLTSCGWPFELFVGPRSE